VRFHNSFEVQAEPDRVYAFLLEVREVITCVPGAALTEVVDEDTYRGKVKIKIGAIGMSYDGTARIEDRDPAQRSAIMRAEARETSGSGNAAMQTELRVAPAPSGSAVTIITDLTITGRAAQFGRGIIEDVSKRLIGQMAGDIKAKLERPDDEVADAQVGTGAGAGAPPSQRPQPAEAAPLNVVALLLSVLRDRLARVFRRRAKSPGTIERSAGTGPES
jgi:uncharacterized protein